MQLCISKFMQMDRCQCSFWRKLFPCLCCCKQVINSSANVTKTCSCSFWRKLFCLCYCEQIIEGSESESDQLTPQSVSLASVQQVMLQLNIIYVYVFILYYVQLQLAKQICNEFHNIQYYDTHQLQLKCDTCVPPVVTMIYTCKFTKCM